MSNPLPLTTCPHCQTLLEYCPGCGASVRETYRAEDKHCARCGAAFSHCPTCGSPIEAWSAQETAPAAPHDKEFIRFCPACGKKIWDITDECPHCKVNVPAYMDRIYSLTVDRVNQITLEEEASLARGDDKDAWAKAKRQRIASARKDTLQIWALILVLLIIAVGLIGAVLYVVVLLFPKNA